MDIPEYKGIKRMRKSKIQIRIIVLLLLCMVYASCSSPRRTISPQAQFQPNEKSLTPIMPSSDLQRKYDYFFLEASRMKLQNNYAAAFDILQHCLDINPHASSALYEIAQYYLYLKD